MLTLHLVLPKEPNRVELLITVRLQLTGYFNSDAAHCFSMGCPLVVADETSLELRVWVNFAPRSLLLSFTHSVSAPSSWQCNISFLLLLYLHPTLPTSVSSPPRRPPAALSLSTLNGLRLRFASVLWRAAWQRPDWNPVAWRQRQQKHFKREKKYKELRTLATLFFRWGFGVVERPTCAIL